MSWMKSTCDFFARHVLRIRRVEDGAGRVDSGIDDDDSSGCTLRTYPLGGDPLHDRIEFHLRDDGPCGFRDPR